jgi:kynurenine formamidase
MDKVTIHEGRPGGERKEGDKMTKRISILLLFVGFGFCFLTTEVLATGEKPTEMGKVIAFLQNGRFVDLTHAFSPSIPNQMGLPRAKREELYGGAIQVFTHVGQYGTHFDPPGHHHKGMRLLDEIPVNEFILEGCVIDISKQAAENPDYVLQLADVEKWEEENGPFPAGSFVLLQSGWSSRWPDEKAYFGLDEEGVKHYPGWGKEALEYLVEKRNIRAIGHETSDTDAGMLCGPDKGWPIESWLLKQDRWQIELMNIPSDANLPPRGFLVVVGVPKADKGTGFPVRVFAILPE